MLGTLWRYLALPFLRLLSRALDVLAMGSSKEDGVSHGSFYRKLLDVFPASFAGFNLRVRCRY